MKTLSFFLLSALINLYPQIPDSLINQPKPKLDSLSLLSDSTFAADSSAILSAEKNKTKVDTLIPLHQTPFFNGSVFINQKEYFFNDYRYAANILQNFGFSFLADKGFIGQPNDLFLFGIGNQGVSYFEDGVFINSRLSNKYDLNNFQSEQIDSVEIIPLPRGFLYGPFNNPVSVNLITKDFISIKPYTKIKFYQGADGEAFIDAMFNSIIYKKFILTVDITNRKFDSTYINSNYSIWQGGFKLKYLLSNKINFSGKYSIVNSKLGFNNGVNTDSISRGNLDFESTFYNNQLAPVNLPFTKENVKQHDFSLGMLGKFLDSSLTKLNLYYRFGQNAHDYNNSSFQYKDYAYGATIEQNYKNNFFTAKFLINYEKSILQQIFFSSVYNSNHKINLTDFSLAPVISFPLLDKKLTPSIFYKYSGRSFNEDYLSHLLNNQNGFGFDIAYNLNSNYKFYAGYSIYKITKYDDLKSVQIGADVELPYLNININAFNRNSIFAFYDLFSLRAPEPGYAFYQPLTGFDFKLNLNLTPLLLETQTSYYYNQEKPGELLRDIPKVNFIGGLYYKNILFKENLNLKTGFKFHYACETKAAYNIYIGRAYLFDNLPESWWIDFTLIGEIQKVAYLYFTWENILDKKFTLTPFYPMRGRNLRFGFSWELFN